MEYSITVEQYFEDIEQYITVDPFPEWLTFSNETMQLKTFTRDRLDADQYFVRIHALARDLVAGIDYESVYNQFELIITLDVPPVSFVPPPEFTWALE